MAAETGFRAMWHPNGSKESRVMKTHVRALVVGGGAVGTSIAYHLARAG